MRNTWKKEFAGFWRSLRGGQNNYDVEVTKTLAKCDLKATDGGRERLLKADVAFGALTVNFL